MVERMDQRPVRFPDGLYRDALADAKRRGMDFSSWVREASAFMLGHQSRSAEIDELRRSIERNHRWAEGQIAAIQRHLEKLDARR